MARITAPVKGFRGLIGDVEFVDSVAETDNEAVIAYCIGAGYTVERDGAAEPLDVPDEHWTVAKLTEWAAAHEVAIPPGAKKADILAAIQSDLL